MSTGPSTSSQGKEPSLSTQEQEKEKKREVRRNGFVGELVKTERDYIQNLKIMSAQNMLAALKEAYKDLESPEKYTALNQVEAWLKNCELVAKAHEQHLLPVLEKFQRGEAKPSEIQEAFAKVKQADEILARSYYDMIADISGTNKAIELPAKFYERFSQIAGQSSKDQGLNTGTSFGNYAILQSQRYARYPMQIDAIRGQSKEEEKAELDKLLKTTTQSAAHYDDLSKEVAERKAGMSHEKWKEVQEEQKELENMNIENREREKAQKQKISSSSGSIKQLFERFSSSKLPKRSKVTDEQTATSKQEKLGQSNNAGSTSESRLSNPLLLSGGPRTSGSQSFFKAENLSRNSLQTPKEEGPSSVSERSPLVLGRHRNRGGG
ncbi:MAG: hypothetical protein JSR17_12750 [Proteobacteria bacterium]|nr:hypothetical protein [Pseudomonadota bacterium]